MLQQVKEDLKKAANRIVDFDVQLKNNSTFSSMSVITS